jgi:hypothetical protein
MRPFLLLSLAASLALHAGEPSFVNAETRWTAERWNLPFAGETMDLLGLQGALSQWPCGFFPDRHDGHLPVPYDCREWAFVAVGTRRSPGHGAGLEGFLPAFTGQRYVPTRSVRSLNGTSVTNPVDLVGLEAYLGLGEGLFALWDMSAATRGQADGYMDILMGLGYAVPLDRTGRWALLGKICGGPAGGGNLDVGGGMA